MSSNVTNQVAYLRTSREFPDDLPGVVEEVEKAYIDIANVVNARTIGLFTVNRPAVTGESWYIFQNKRQQSLRQVYTQTVVGGVPAAINHGLNLNLIDGFSRLFGTYTDATGNWYGLIAGSNVAIPGQISFYITPTGGSPATTGQIIFLVGAGAPVVTKLRVVLEWLSQP